MKSLTPDQLVIGETYLIDGRLLLLEELDRNQGSGIPSAEFSHPTDGWFEFAFGATSWYSKSGWHPYDQDDPEDAEPIIMQHSDPITHMGLTMEEK